MPNTKLPNTKSNRIGTAPDHEARIISLERKLELLQHDHELSSYEELKAIREDKEALESANQRLAARVADLERRANIDHLTARKRETYRDGIASMRALAGAATQSARERRRLDKRIAALELARERRRLEQRIAALEGDQA